MCVHRAESGVDDSIKMEMPPLQNIVAQGDDNTPEDEEFDEAAVMELDEGQSRTHWYGPKGAVKVRPCREGGKEW